uniref:Uncharacterized protein n=1 Tax=Nelumbo nucifera TaxID=4432 RepID=A0A822YHD3_NELNU|nr:TPA_asm: hypothetical protein HUJ06_010851 [Nelumbo nucifera]
MRGKRGETEDVGLLGVGTLADGGVSLGWAAKKGLVLDY